MLGADLGQVDTLLQEVQGPGIQVACAVPGLAHVDVVIVHQLKLPNTWVCTVREKHFNTGSS